MSAGAAMILFYGLCVVVVILALAALVGGFVLKMIWDAVIALRAETHGVRGEVSDVKLLVAGSYVTRDEFVRVLTDWRGDQQKTNARLFDKLDAIAEKVGAH